MKWYFELFISGPVHVFRRLDVPPRRRRRTRSGRHRRRRRCASDIIAREGMTAAKPLLLPLHTISDERSDNVGCVLYKSSPFLCVRACVCVYPCIYIRARMCVRVRVCTGVRTIAGARSRNSKVYEDVRKAFGNRLKKKKGFPIRRDDANTT